MAAIKTFALRHPKTGYRKLTYTMLDQDIVAASESAVYRVLREADLLSRWKRSARSSGEYSFRPTGPNQQWHTDVMYIWVRCRHYIPAVLYRCVQSVCRAPSRADRPDEASRRDGA